MQRKVYRTRLKPECRQDYIEAHKNVSSELFRRYREAGMRLCAVCLHEDELVLLIDAEDIFKTSAILAKDPVESGLAIPCQADESRRRLAGDGRVVLRRPDHYELSCSRD